MVNTKSGQMYAIRTEDKLEKRMCWEMCTCNCACHLLEYDSEMYQIYFNVSKAIVANRKCKCGGFFGIACIGPVYCSCVKSVCFI